jgi:hypothetical protein
MSDQHLIPDEQYRSVMIQNHLQSFADVWNVQADWFETPNKRRSGWSGVSRIELQMPNNTALPVFLKRQQNHNTFSVRHPFGQPTFKREYYNIINMKTLGLPVAPLVYYGEQRIDGQSCAALITVALDDFQSVDKWWESHTQPEARQAALFAIAHWVAQLSKQRWEYGCLYDKHIFIRNTPTNDQFNQNDIRFIDLEKMRRRLTVTGAAKANIEQLLRHSKCCSPAEQQYLVTQFNTFMRLVN